MEFKESVGSSEYLEALLGIEPATSLSLYVHIPYCHEICWYCGCNTGAANRKQRLDAYIESLEQEIVTVARLVAGRGKVARIAFGGGSPNAIELVDFVRIVDRLMILFGADSPAISIEIDPRSFTLEWAQMLASIRTNRVSLGVQTFAPHVQSAIGRIQSIELIENCVSLLRLRGIEQVNFDLMYGLPGQSLRDLEDTIVKAIEMRPSRIALFGYAHLPSMIPRQRRIDSETLPDIELRFQQSQRGHQMLVEAGYKAIGFDHFALPNDTIAQAADSGKVHRNFQGFTEDDSPIILGFGASAISKFPRLLVQNIKNVGAYRDAVQSGNLPVERGAILGEDDQNNGRIIEQLLCQGTANISPDVIDSVWPRLSVFAQRGLLKRETDRIVIPEAGRPYSRLISSQFDRYRDTSIKVAT